MKKVMLALMIMVLAGLTAFGVYYISLFNVGLATVFGCLAGLILLFIVCAYVAYYHSTNHLQFEEVEYYYEKRLAKKAAKAQPVKEVNDVKEEVVVVAPVEEKAEVKAEEKPAVKKTTRKTTTPKKTAPKE